jgi:hypothetical protein
MTQTAPEDGAYAGEADVMDEGDMDMQPDEAESYAYDTEAPDGGTADAPGPEESADEFMENDLMSMCPDFEGDQMDEVTCDGTLAPRQSATCREAVSDGLWSMQAVTYKAKSLLEFSLPIHDLPPEEVMEDLSYMGVNGRMAMGIIVAFADKNGDQVFNKGDADRIEDRLLSASALTTEDEHYVGWVMFLDGESPARHFEISGILEQGFNIVIEDEYTVRVVDIDEPISLIPMETSGAGPELAEIQCNNIDYIYDFNGPVPTETPFGCAGFGGGGPGPDGIIINEMGWEVHLEDPANPCAIRVSSGYVCYTDEGQVPETWWDYCSALMPSDEASAGGAAAYPDEAMSGTESGDADSAAGE